MAKDPAILWYFDNWAGGTITLSRHLKGCYMDLLNAQFNNGHLSVEEIKTVLGSDFSAWNTLQKKFDRDGNGLFFSKRMDAEIEKRKKFSEKQSLNGSKGGRPKEDKPKENPDETLLGNGNIKLNSEIENTEGVQGEIFESILKLFGFESQMNFPARHAETRMFLYGLSQTGKLNQFEKQFEFYVKYKNSSQEKLHSFPGFISGGWEQENWEKKYNDFNKEKKPIQPVIKAPVPKPLTKEELESLEWTKKRLEASKGEAEQKRNNNNINQIGAILKNRYGYTGDNERV